jgi:low temperature requirement protein LtrA
MTPTPLAPRARWGLGVNLLRKRGSHEGDRVSFVELFFDLVFVFAVTQLSHSLLAHPSLQGLAETTLMMMAVWWVWIYTSWVTNWLDPEQPLVRLMLFVLMLAGMVLSMAIPTAFDSGAMVFVAAYTLMQIGRSLFMMAAMARHAPANYRTFARITAWFALSGAFWVAGGWLAGEVRVVLWVAALAIEYAAPACSYWTPGLGRSSTTDWNISGAHMAERCGLFVIIALGESLLVTGASFAEMPWDRESAMAFVVAFIGAIAMWWIYFNIGAERATRLISQSADPGRLARLAYTYVHLVLVAGIVLSAVADELVIHHPHDKPSAAIAYTVLGGNALFLLGNLVFKRVTWARSPLSHIVGLGGLAGLAIMHSSFSALGLATASTAMLVLVAGWETLSLGRRHLSAQHD